MRRQVGTPVTQVTAPISQATPVEHDAPSRQAMHAPEGLHTWSVPQEVPGVSRPGAAQVGTPEVQTVTPVSQGLPVGEQGVRSVHDTQRPRVLHTMPPLGVQRYDEFDMIEPAALYENCW